MLVTLLIGTNLNSANRWLTIPVINQTFQTSDLAKLALIMYVARFLALKQDVIKDFKRGFFPLLVPIFLVCGLILPADLSTAAMLFDELPYSHVYWPCESDNIWRFWLLLVL